MKLKIFAISIFLFGTLNVSAQSPSPVLKDNSAGDQEAVYQIGDIRGTVKRKAVYLAKPPYPREALEAGADGAVRVEVTIDAEGTVVSAKATAGHPLLYQTAEETARKSKFRRSDAPAPSAAETGTIVYNFAIEKAGWLRIGYDLSVIQKAPSLRPFLVPRAAKAFSPDWTGEHELLGKIAEMRRIEMETLPAMPDRPVLVRQPAPTGAATPQNEVRGQFFVPVPNPPTPERIALAQNLISLLQSRLASDEASLWRFNLGVNLAKAFEFSRNPNNYAGAAALLRQTLDGAPPGTHAETLDALRTMIRTIENGWRPTDSAGDEYRKAVALIFRTK
jgi:TonB family protein